MQLLDSFQLSTLQLLDGFNYPLCSYWMISTILYAVTVWFSTIYNAVTGLFSTIHNAVTGWLSTIHYAVTAWFSTNHFAVTGWLSTIHNAVTGWFSTIHYAVTGWFSTIHYVVSYWMVVMTISRLLTICTRRYSKETNNKKLQISQPTSLHVLAVVNYLI
jgi:Flp pilus assembly pilin Flp